MNTFKILVQGYAHAGENSSYVASPTCTFVESLGKKVLVDPGANQEKLLEALHKDGLTPADIDIVFLSHFHPDHFLAIRLFPTHDIVDGEMIWSEDKEIFHDKKFIPHTDIKLLPTPGHAPEHTSLIITTQDKGKICIAQDVFWWEDGKQKSDSVKDLINLKDPFASDEKALKESREKVLKIADWIIPGHGKIFKNPETN